MNLLYPSLPPLFCRTPYSFIANVVGNAFLDQHIYSIASLEVGPPGIPLCRPRYHLFVLANFVLVVKIPCVFPLKFQAKAHDSEKVEASFYACLLSELQADQVEGGFDYVENRFFSLLTQATLCIPLCCHERYDKVSKPVVIDKTEKL